jgi:hypothetical protein
MTHCTHSHPTPEEDDLRAVGVRPLVECLLPGARAAIEGAGPALLEFAETRVKPRLNVRRRKYFAEVGASFTLWAGFNVVGERSDGGPVVRERLFRLSGREAPPPSLAGPLWYEDPVDDVVQVLLFRRAAGAGRPVGCVLRFSAHATASGHTPEKRWGGDYPYFARQAAERELGAPCLFLTGPCGDLAPAERCAWSVTRGSPGSPGPFVPKGYASGAAAEAEAKREGELLARCALQALASDNEPKPLELMSASVLEVEVEVRETILDSLASIRDAVEEKRAAYDRALRGGADLLELKHLADKYLHFSYMNLVHEKYYYASREEVRARRFTSELPHIRLNDILIAGFPGEVCQDVTFALRQTLNHPVITLTEMNGDAGYMAPAGEFPFGDYEVNCSITTPTALSKLVAAHLGRPGPS